MYPVAGPPRSTAVPHSMLATQCRLFICFLQLQASGLHVCAVTGAGAGAALVSLHTLRCILHFSQGRYLEPLKRCSGGLAGSGRVAILVGPDSRFGWMDGTFLASCCPLDPVSLSSTFTAKNDSLEKQHTLECCGNCKISAVHARQDLSATPTLLRTSPY